MNAAIKKIKNKLQEPLDPRARRDMERTATDKLVARADVILSTLSSSSNSLMEKFFLQVGHGAHVNTFGDVSF